MIKTKSLIFFVGKNFSTRFSFVVKNFSTLSVFEVAGGSLSAWGRGGQSVSITSCM